MSSRYHSSFKFLLLLLLLPGLAGCATIAWYGQAARGQIEVLAKREDIAQLLADPATSPALAQRLRTVLEIREFATRELGLPDSGSYTLYANLGRPAPLWNVVAAPRYSVQPRSWCYPLVGCVAYRGFFRHRQATDLAAQLEADGFDVAVYPATAYSTLGWFADPVLDSMLALPDPDLAELIFHELAHELLYVRGDAAFSEAFATFVGRLGARRWLAHRGDDERLQRWQADQRLNRQLNALLLAARKRLARRYAETSDPEKLARNKRREFQRLDARLDELARVHDSARIRAWQARDLNNAHLAVIATYESGIAAFQSHFQTECYAHLSCLYAHARYLARGDSRQRADFLGTDH